MPNFKHLVVLMLENRSFDNMLGVAYDQGMQPKQKIPNDARIYFGLEFDLTGTGPSAPGAYSNPSATVGKVAISPATDFTMPHPDPGEHFDRITAQIFGHARPPIPEHCDMSGFLMDFAESAGSAGAAGIMHYYTPVQVPVITSLARNFAVCDRWFAASPTQTLPNRAFAHAGTSNGKVNNSPYDPFDFNVRTIFNVLEDLRKSWAVYKDTHLHGLEKFCGTRVQFPKLWKLPDERFKHLDDFHNDVRNGTLPLYSFIEPRLLMDGNDQHPPRDVRLGESLMFDIYESIRACARPEDILLLVTYDEHGGCYDHVPPPFSAVAPDHAPGEFDFHFDRYGVRVPAILVSPYIEAGTVFRSAETTADHQEIPFSHTSILATLRDWLGIGEAAMLPSARVKVAPTFLDVLTRQDARPMPTIDSPHKISKIERVLDFAEEANDLQISLAMGLTRWADEVQQTKMAADPSLVNKLKSRAFLIPHVVEEIRRIKSKQSN